MSTIMKYSRTTRNKILALVKIVKMVTQAIQMVKGRSPVLMVNLVWQASYQASYQI